MKKPPIGTPCGYCFKEWAILYDHMKPRRLGGGNDMSNLHPSCSRCNMILAWHTHKSVEERIAFVRQELIEKGEWN
ncbi:hypothetical protein LCGC14_1424270 [marine sediment metagenome]|uniref:HNH domain-containing protein n=1 Tax=marine sediment metagenome TaxID=412755 RepID=A0A0F9JQA0_9ZZZZ